MNEALKINPISIESLLLRDGSHFMMKHYDLAVKDYAEVIRLKPNNPDAYRSLGLVYLQKRDADLSLANFNEVIRLDPASNDAYENRGRAYMALGEFDLAIADFENQLKLDPDNLFIQKRLLEIARRISKPNFTASSIFDVLVV